MASSPKKAISTASVTHILKGGVTMLCGSALDDGKWKNDHDWIAQSEDKEVIDHLVTCAKCRAEAELNVSPTHYLDEIDSIYAFLSDDDGGEGIVGLPIGPNGSLIPLIASDRTRLNQIIPLVKEMAESGIKIKLVQFTNRNVIEEYETSEG